MRLTYHFKNNSEEQEVLIKQLGRYRITNKKLQENFVGSVHKAYMVNTFGFNP